MLHMGLTYDKHSYVLAFIVAVITAPLCAQERSQGQTPPEKEAVSAKLTS